MASTFIIGCPDCGKQIKVTEELIGKKIRCKECGGVLPVRAPAVAKAPAPSKKKPVEPPKPAATKAKPEPKPKPVDEDEDDDKPGTAYSLAASDEGIPRCPFCTKELETKEDRICLHCGYDLVERKRAQKKVVYEATGQEKFVWLLPGILCVVGIIALITISIVCMVHTKEWMKDGLFHNTDDGKDEMVIKPGCFMLANGMMVAFICFHLGKIAYRRLVLNNQPPETEIGEDDPDADDDDDDEDDDDDD